MKAVYTTYEYQYDEGEFFTQAYVTIWGEDGKKAESFDAPWWGIETPADLKFFLEDYYEYSAFSPVPYITEWEFAEE
jgi:hypothetical protein